ncbi:unnamed protein product, partial [Mesorhabditis spiculigera]
MSFTPPTPTGLMEFTFESLSCPGCHTTYSTQLESSNFPLMLNCGFPICSFCCEHNQAASAEAQLQKHTPLCADWAECSLNVHPADIVLDLLADMTEFTISTSHLRKPTPTDLASLACPDCQNTYDGDSLGPSRPFILDCGHAACGDCLSKRKYQRQKKEYPFFVYEYKCTRCKVSSLVTGRVKSQQQNFVTDFLTEFDPPSRCSSRHSTNTASSSEASHLQNHAKGNDYDYAEFGNESGREIVEVKRENSRLKTERRRIRQERQMIAEDYRMLREERQVLEHERRWMQEQRARAEGERNMLSEMQRQHTSQQEKLNQLILEQHGLIEERLRALDLKKRKLREQEAIVVELDRVSSARSDDSLNCALMEHLPDSPPIGLPLELWTNLDVAAWARGETENDLVVSILIRERISGAVLAGLTFDELRKELKLPLGDAKQLEKGIVRLKDQDLAATEPGGLRERFSKFRRSLRPTLRRKKSSHSTNSTNVVSPDN